MIKSLTLAAGLIAGSLMALSPQPAAAGSNLHLQFGIGSPYFGYYGHYGAPRYGDYSHYRPRKHRARKYRRRISCRQARRLLRHRGFHRIRARDCEGRRYSFRAYRYGDWWGVRMNSRSGRIIGMWPL